MGFFLYILCMKICNFITKNLLSGKVCVASFSFGLAVFGLAACGEDSASAEVPDSPSAEIPASSGDVVTVRSSDAKPDDKGETPVTNGSSSSSSQQKVSSSSKKTETPVSEEVLNEPSMVVTGRCAPLASEIQKGEIAEWRFDRDNGSVFEVIMAPFAWEFPELGKTFKGNGLNKVDVAFPEAGVFSAKLNVDGTEISCGSLQVQGIPIEVASCKPDKSNANAGETVTWTVEATSDAEIVDYAWSFADGDVTGSGATGAILTTEEMHKANIAPVVVITNADKTAQRYTCESAYVINPNKVDYAFVKGGETVSIPTGENWVVQIPEDCATCTLVCQVQGASISIFVNEESLSAAPKVDYFGEGIGTYNGQKVQFRVESTASTVSCNVTPW